MRSWIQAFLRRIGNVHELDAQRLAIGAAQDGEDFAQRAEFEAEHPVEKDRPVHVGVGEAVGARVEILLVAVGLEAERIEIGVEVPARAVGADQHQGADRIARRLLDLRGGELDAAGLRPRLDLVAERLLDLAANRRRARKRVRRARACGQFGRCHDGPLALFDDVAGVVLEALEERLPLGIDRPGSAS